MVSFDRRIAVLPVALIFACPSPAHVVAVPADLAIQIEVDGQPREKIDAEMLKRIAPDFSTADAVAWNLEALVPHEVIDGRVAEVEDEERIRTVLLGPNEKPGDRRPVLEISREGDVRIALIPKDGSYPPHSAREAASKRRSVAAIRFSKEAPPAPAEPVGVEVLIDREAARTVALASTDVKPFSVASGDGSGQRDAWPLRDLARAIAGSASAMVVEVVNAEGTSATIDAASWRDEAKMPVLRVNRKGKMKLVWLSAKLEPIDDAGVLKDVTKIRVATAEQR